MPSLKMSVPHSLGQEKAKEILETYLGKLLNKFQDKVSNLQQSWSGNQLTTSFTSMGFSVKGTLDVLPDEIKIDGTIPLAALMFKGKIEKGIRDELTRVLA